MVVNDCFFVVRRFRNGTHRNKKRQHEKSQIAQAQGSMGQNDMWKIYATVIGSWHQDAMIPVMFSELKINLLAGKTMVEAR